MERISRRAALLKLSRATWRIIKALAGLLALLLAAALCALPCVFAWVTLAMYPGGG